MVFSIRLYFEYAFNLDEIDRSDSELEIARQYFLNAVVNNENIEFEPYIYAIGSMCLWIKILFFFRLTRFLGPLFKIIQSMLSNIAIFMVLFITQLIIFGTVGNLLFNSMDAYQSFYITLKTLFSAALANYDFADLEGNPRGEIVGDCFIIIFIILNNILLLNLLIAILSSTYAIFEGNKLVLYINEILKLRSSMQYNKSNSSLISTFPPWNIIAILFMPFIMLSKGSTLANQILFHIEYVPCLILLFSIYLALNLVILPFTYLKGIKMAF